MSFIVVDAMVVTWNSLFDRMLEKSLAVEWVGREA